jgi:hypothetical protein
MSGARRFVSKHALLLFFFALFTWTVLGTTGAASRLNLLGAADNSLAHSWPNDRVAEDWGTDEGQHPKYRCGCTF